METTNDKSYGVVPVIKVKNKWQVLLVEQISYRGSNDRFWTFPKGHPEANESPLETAKRELTEETGIKDVRLIEDAKFSIEYSFKHESKKINKTVSYYLGICANEKTNISLPDEIANLAWLNFKEAMKTLTHDNAKQILLSAGEFITANEHRL